MLMKKSKKIDSSIAIDAAAIFHLFWVFLSLAYVHGVIRSMEAGGVYAIEFLSFYIFGRWIALSIPRLVRFLKMFYSLVIFFLISAWIEALTGFNIFYDILGLSYSITDEPRFGLERARQFATHSILYGLFVSSFFSLCIYTISKDKIRTFFIFFLASFAALSSAPFLSIAIQSGLLSWDYVFRKNKKRWLILIGLVVCGFVFISLASNRPVINVLLTYITFNPYTAFYRLAIWEYGSDEVMRHPMFGIGFNEWLRPWWMHGTSVDNFWLLTAMRFGLPAVISLFVVKILIARQLIIKDYEKLTPFCIGWIISMAGIFFVGTTVHFWSNVFIMYAVFLGIGASLAGYSKTAISNESQKLKIKKV